MQWKKGMVLLLASMMVLKLSITVFAQEVDLTASEEAEIKQVTETPINDAIGQQVEIEADLFCDEAVQETEEKENPVNGEFRPEQVVSMPNEQEILDGDIADEDAENLTRMQSEMLIDFSMNVSAITYVAPSRGRWNPLTLQYENSTEGRWSMSDNRINLTNKSDQVVDLKLNYVPASGYETISAYYTNQNGNTVSDITLQAYGEEGSTQTVYLNMSGKPNGNFASDTIGTISYSLQPVR